MNIVAMWREALAGVRVRYPGDRVVHVDVQDDGYLRVWLDEQIDSRDGVTKMPGFCVSNVLLTFWPGAKLARAWLAAAWAGYIQHEALELVTDARGMRPLDPHAEPYDTNPWNRGLRDGFPPTLDVDALVAGLAVVMPIEDARAMVARDRV